MRCNVHPTTQPQVQAAASAYVSLALETEVSKVVGSSLEVWRPTPVRLENVVTVWGGRKDLVHDLVVHMASNNGG